MFMNIVWLPIKKDCFPFTSELNVVKYYYRDTIENIYVKYCKLDLSKMFTLQESTENHPKAIINPDNYKAPYFQLINLSCKKSKSIKCVNRVANNIETTPGKTLQHALICFKSRVLVLSFTET